MQQVQWLLACEVLDSFCKGRKVSCSRDTNEADAPILLRMKAMSQGSRFRHETLRMDKTNKLFATALHRLPTPVRIHLVPWKEKIGKNQSIMVQGLHTR